MIVEVTDEVVSKLRDRGVSINLPAGKHIINDESFFEAPCFVSSTIGLDTVVQVGAFSGIYGGQIRHCRLGRYCSIAPSVQIGWDEHPTAYITSSMLGYVPRVHGWSKLFNLGADQENQFTQDFQTIKGITEIGNDVWIGHGAFIRSGIRIGTGAVIGASAVVVNDIPPYSIWAGNPARLIKMRFDSATIAALIESNWWNYSIFDFPPSLISQPGKFLDWLNSKAQKSEIEAYSPQLIDGRVINDLVQSQFLTGA